MVVKWKSGTDGSSDLYSSSLPTR